MPHRSTDVPPARVPADGPPEPGDAPVSRSDLDACLRVLDRVPQATILDGGRPHALVEHLLEGRTPGTVFTAA